MSKIPIILPATTFSFCPDGHKLFGTMWTGPSAILMEPCWPLCTNNVWIFWVFFLWMKLLCQSSLTLQPSKHRTIVTWGQKCNKRISTYIFEGINTRIYGITFNLICSLQFKHMVWAGSTHLIYHYSRIWHGSGFSSQNITVFSIQQFNAQPHNRCSFSPKFLQQSRTNGWQQPAVTSSGY